METRVFSQQLEQGNYPPCVDIILAHKESLAVCGDIVENGLECLPKRSYSGGHALISRLEYEDKVYGTVGIYVQSDYIPDPEEQSLFRELAGDIAFALYNIDREEILKQSEERFSKVFHANPLGLSITRLTDGQYIDVNDAFLRVFGYEREEALSQTSVQMQTWVFPKERERLVKILQDNGNIRNIETQYRRKSGEIFTALISAELIDVAGERYSWAYCRTSPCASR
jgi:PAS domain S-box-containing protein